MQKRILASFMVAPVAVSALANINVGMEKWNTNGISDADGKLIIPTQQDGKWSMVTTTLATGYAYTNLQLAPGQYEIGCYLAGASIEVYYQGAPAEVTLKEGSTNTYTFNLPGDAGISEYSVEIRIQGNNKENFVMRNFSMAIVYDFAAEYARLQAIADVNPLEIPADYPAYFKPSIDALTKERATVVAAQDAAKAEVEKLNAPAAEDQVYKENQLWLKNNPIQAAVDAYVKARTDFDQELTNLNKTIAGYNGQAAVKAGLEDGATALQNSLNGIKANIVAGSYVDQQTKADIAAIESQIKNYKDAIDKAYTDDAMAEGEIKFTPDPDEATIRKAIEELQNKVNQAALDDAAFKAWTARNVAFNDANTKARERVFALAGVTAFPENFNDMKTEALTKIQAEFDKLIDPQYSEEAWNNYNPTSQAAIDEINKIANDLVTFVTDLNAAYTDATVAIDKKEAELNKLKNNEFVAPADKSEEYKNLVAAAEKALKDAQDAVDKAYQAKETIPTDLSAVTDAIDKVSTFQSDYAPMIGLMTDLENWWDGIQLPNSTLGKNSDAVLFVVDKFEATKNNIADRINGLGANPSEADKQAVTDAIANADKNAKAMYNAYTGIADGIKAFRTEMDKLSSLLTTAEKLEGNEFDAEVWKADSETYKELQSKLTDFESRFNKATTDETLIGADCQKTLETLANDVKEYAYATSVQTLAGEILTAVSNGNTAVADVKLAALQKLIDDNADAAGMSAVDLTTLTSALKTITDKYPAANEADAADVDTTDTNKVTEELKKFFNEKSQYQTTLDNVINLIDNRDHYKALTGMIPALENILNDVITTNNENSLDPALSFFDNILEGANNADSYKAKLAKLQKDIEDAYQKNKLFSDSDTSVYTGYAKNLSDVNSELEALDLQIVENSQAYTALTAESQVVRAYLNTMLESFAAGNEAGKYNTEVPEIAQAQKDIENLLNESLPAIDGEVNGVYATGEAGDPNKTALLEKYAALKASADKIMDEVKAQYGTYVDNANSATVNAAGWDATKAALDEAYNKAVTAYNSYLYYIYRSADYAAEIEETVKKYAQIFNYAEDIRDLKIAVSKWIADQNEADIAFTLDQFNAVATDKATDLNTLIANTVAAMEAALQSNSIAFGQTVMNATQADIDAAEATLESAGISAENAAKMLKGVQDKQTAANTNYNTAVENAGKPDFVFGLSWLKDMDNAIADSEQAFDGVTIAQLVADYWTTTYGGAQTELAGYQTTYNSLAKYASDQDKKDFAAAVKAINDLKSFAPEYTAEKNNLAQMSENLDTIESSLATAKAIAEKLKKADENNAAFNQFSGDMDKAVADFRADGLADLQQFVAGLAGAPQSIYTGFVEGAFQNFLNAVENLKKGNPANVTALKAQFAAAQADLQAALEKAFRTAVQAEYTAMGSNSDTTGSTSWLNQVKVAYNNAMAQKVLSADKAPEVLNNIGKLAQRITDLKALYVVNDFLPVNADAFEAAAQELEDALGTQFNELQNLLKGLPESGWVDLAAVLANIVDPVQADINAANAALGDYDKSVQDEFAAPMADAQAALDKLKADYEADAAAAWSEAKYQDRADAIADTVAEISKKAAAAEKAYQDGVAKKAANDAAFATLSEQLNGLNDLYNEVNEYLTAEEQKDTRMADIEKWLKAAEKNLNDRNAAIGLDKNSTLDGGSMYTAATVKSTLNNINVTAHQNVAVAAIGLANDAYSEAQTALAGYVVPEVKAELQKLLEAVKIPALSEAKNNKIDKLNTTIANARAAMDQCNSIAGQAKESTFVPGCINGGTEPDVADVQKLIGWVLNGVTSVQDAIAESVATPVEAYAANVTNDKEGLLNISDVAVLINMVMGDENGNILRAPKYVASGIRQGNNAFTITELESEGEVRRFAIDLSNADSFIAGQLRIVPVAGLTIQSVELGERASGHDLYTADNLDGTRVVIASMENATLEGNSGTLLIVEATGRGKINVDQAIFADKNCEAVGIGSDGTTFIDSVIEGARNLRQRIYDAAGRQLNRLQKGINIIRNSDGSTKKIMGDK